ncbi:septum formation protein Maf [Candidatus Parcubacteria bacterium]|jgi:septum formation protein|nr:septum formation protein Maf [Candidatus Parcubacteria bacterium]
MQKIILASGSPRRKQLLKQIIGDNFVIKTSSYEEDNELNIPPKDLVLKHSLAKGRDVANNLDEGIVISADTLIFYKGEVFGKPHTEENARRALKKISGKSIECITGMAVIDVKGRQEVQDYTITKLKIKSLTDKEIDDYIKAEQILDHAGSFAYEQKGAVLIESIDGCYYNVIGLPLNKLHQILNKLGVSSFDYK